MTSSGGLFGSRPTTRSISGITTKTNTGPKNQKRSDPVHSTSPQARNGMAGITAPRIQAYLLVSFHSRVEGGTACAVVIGRTPSPRRAGAVPTGFTRR